MRILFIITAQTLREGLRKRFLAGLWLACFLILCSSLIFAQISLDDRGRLTVDFGLSGAQILLAALAVFFGSGFIAADLDKKLWMILTRPVRPSALFLGRYLGLSALLFLGWLALSSLLILFFFFLKIPIQPALFFALFGFFLESLLLLAFVFLFSSYVSSFLVLFYSLSVFVIGHFLESLFYFAEKAPPGLKIALTQAFRFLPNLEKVNWKSAVVYQDQIPFSELAFSSLYIFLWIGLALSLALLLMERREYG